MLDLAVKLLAYYINKEQKKKSLLKNVTFLIAGRKMQTVSSQCRTRVKLPSQVVLITNYKSSELTALSVSCLERMQWSYYLSYCKEMI